MASFVVFCVDSFVVTVGNICSIHHTLISLSYIIYIFYTGKRSVVVTVCHSLMYEFVSLSSFVLSVIRFNVTSAADICIFCYKTRGKERKGEKKIMYIKYIYYLPWQEVRSGTLRNFCWIPFSRVRTQRDCMRKFREFSAKLSR